MALNTRESPLQDISQAPPRHPHSSSHLGLGGGKCGSGYVQMVPTHVPALGLHGSGKGTNIALHKIAEEPALVESCFLFHHLELIFNALEQEGL